jgi:hypothetical protein
MVHAIRNVRLCFEVFGDNGNALRTSLSAVALQTQTNLICYVRPVIDVFFNRVASMTHAAMLGEAQTVRAPTLTIC